MAIEASIEPRGEAHVIDHNHHIGRTAFGPFELRWSETPGSREEPIVLLLHGIYAGAHRYEWRRLVPEITGARVRVPDLLGAGDSDRPNLEYNPEVIESCVDALIRDCGSNVHVVASSLVGAYAVRAVANGAPAASLTLITPSGFGTRRERRNRRSAAFYWLCRHTPLGTALVTALTSGPSVRWFQRNKTYRDPASLDEAEVSATRRAGRLPGAKHLQLAFVCDRLSIDIERGDVERLRPLVVWADGQDFVDSSEADEWAAAGATVRHVEAGLPQVETPAELARLIEAQTDVVVLEADREGGAVATVEPNRGAQHQEVRS